MFFIECNLNEIFLERKRLVKVLFFIETVVKYYSTIEFINVYNRSIDRLLDNLARLSYFI